MLDAKINQDAATGLGQAGLRRMVHVVAPLEVGGGHHFRSTIARRKVDERNKDIETMWRPVLFTRIDMIAIAVPGLCHRAGHGQHASSVAEPTVLP